jgi:hypothetical protein
VRDPAGRVQVREDTALEDVTVLPILSGTGHSSRDIRRRSLPDFLDTTVATVVKPALR